MGGFVMRNYSHAKKHTEIYYRGTGCDDLATAGALKPQRPRAKTKALN
jgi:hypothetical protein